MFWQILVIVFAVFGLIIGFFSEFDGWIDSEVLFASITAGVSAATVVGIIGLIGSVTVSDFNLAVKTSKPDVRSWGLVNMADGSTKTSGSFFLGTGTINQTSMYTFYIDYGNRFQQVSLETYGVDIVYTDQKPVYSEYGHFETEDTFWTWFASEKEWIVDRREFQIPAGSIQQDYTLDAK